MRHLTEAWFTALLIWGNNDTITPPFVGREFQRLIQNSELHFIDKCGHAPMMERPEEFNELLRTFLAKQSSPIQVE
jgi:pimeloyl-ACP methyl ester carboxylesterase